MKIIRKEKHFLHVLQKMYLSDDGIEDEKNNDRPAQNHHILARCLTYIISNQKHQYEKFSFNCRSSDGIIRYDKLYFTKK